MAKLLGRSVEKAVGGEETVGVAFSGGLDSSVVAKCAARHARVVACTAYVRGSRDSTGAREAASSLGIQLVATELDKKGVQEMLPAIDLPFVPDLMDRSLWCLYRAASRSAQLSGAKVLLLGQLADELFGGYAKYAEALARKGEKEAAAMMGKDVREYAARGRIRDVAACGDLAEPRFPFEAPEVVEFANSLPLSFKIRGGERKAVLRRAAQLLGVPRVIAEAPKKAAQYSSGVQKLVGGSHF